MSRILLFILCTALATRNVSAWVSSPLAGGKRRTTALGMSSAPSDVGTEPTLGDMKIDLVRRCRLENKPSAEEMRYMIQEFETKAEMAGIGQASSLSGLLSGEWELLYAPDDVTRSSPFFWAFRKAFPDQSDQIFSITDAIPAPIKEVGPAYQKITMIPETGRGQFVSRVKVATLGGLATSMMTTKGTIIGTDGVDGIKIQIETTKPEESTALQTLLGPLGSIINENAPAFPSGQALEQVQPGSSCVIMRTTFCDEGLRISRNDERRGDIFVWRRKEFNNFESL